MNKFPNRCKLAPRGWICYLEKNHSGPCPAWPLFWWNPILWFRFNFTGRPRGR